MRSGSTKDCATRCVIVPALGICVVWEERLAASCGAGLKRLNKIALGTGLGREHTSVLPMSSQSSLIGCDSTPVAVLRPCQRLLGSATMTSTQLNGRGSLVHHVHGGSGRTLLECVTYPTRSSPNGFPGEKPSEAMGSRNTRRAAKIRREERIHIGSMVKETIGPVKLAMNRADP